MLNTFSLFIYQFSEPDSLQHQISKKPRKEIRCSACKQLGHSIRNKNCPEYTHKTSNTVINQGLPNEVDIDENSDLGEKSEDEDSITEIGEMIDDAVDENEDFDHIEESTSTWIENVIPIYSGNVGSIANLLPTFGGYKKRNDTFEKIDIQRIEENACLSPLNFFNLYIRDGQQYIVTIHSRDVRKFVNC